MVRELLGLTIANELNPSVRKRLAEVVQLVQSYCRLAELELAAGERPKAGDVKLPKDLSERTKRWAEREDAKVRKREELAGQLSEAMQAHGQDAGPLNVLMGG